MDEPYPCILELFMAFMCVHKIVLDTIYLGLITPFQRGKKTNERTDILVFKHGLLIDDQLATFECPRAQLCFTSCSGYSLLELMIGNKQKNLDEIRSMNSQYYFHDRRQM